MRDGAKGPGTKGAGISDAARRAILRRRGKPRFSLLGAAIEVMAPNSLIPHDSCALGPADEDGCERPQSITAALRMQTIVACAGFPLRLRMR